MPKPHPKSPLQALLAKDRSRNAYEAQERITQRDGKTGRLDGDEQVAGEMIVREIKVWVFEGRSREVRQGIRELVPLSLRKL